MVAYDYRLNPPEPSEADLAYEAECQDRHDEAYDEVMAGLGDFWNQIVRPYDADQELRIFAAVGLAVGSFATNTMDDAEFRAVIMKAVKLEAERYADYIVEQI